MSAVVPDTDLDEEAVALVRLPPSPLLEAAVLPASASLPSSSTVLPDPSSIAVQPPPPKEPPPTAGPSTTIPTPKSSTADEPSPPHNPSSATTPIAPGTTSSGTPVASVPLVDVDTPVAAENSVRGAAPPTAGSSSGRGSQDNCMFCTAETAPPGENLEWIQCNGCKRWAHTLCTGLPAAIDIVTIDKFHCKRCEKTRGPTTFHPPPRKSERSHVNIDYTTLNLGDTNSILPDQHAYNAFFEGSSPRKFGRDRFQRMNGAELTRAWAEETGCQEPVVIPGDKREGLKMIMPEGLTVRKVAELVGHDAKVEVIDVPTQKEAPNWRLKAWADYYDTPADQRDRVRNVISLEVSSSPLGAQVLRPKFVRDLDLIEKVWPKHLRPPLNTPTNTVPVHLPTSSNTPSAITFPKVTLYCLMSVARSYTDFHVDFGGSSVFYHILRGRKTFLFIEPSAGNLRRYEAWCLDSEQGKRFLGEEVRECVRVDLEAGDTMIIPSGWIHAVYTPTDSLVLGGNFLTPLHIISQLNIASIETKTRVPKKFRFPFFDLAMWYTAIYYLESYPEKKKPGPKPRARRNTDGMSSYELDGLKALAEWLWKKAKLRCQQVAKGAEYHRAKVEVPPGIDVTDVASRFARWIYEAEFVQARGGEEEGPGWYRTEVLKLKNEKGDVRKRKRVEEIDGEGSPVAAVTPTRKYSRRVAARKHDAVQVVVPVSLTRETRNVDMFSLSRAVKTTGTAQWGMSRPSITYATWTTPSYPLITYPPPSLSIPPPRLDLIKPYSTATPKKNPQTETFVMAIKSLYRPYIRTAKPDPPSQTKVPVAQVMVLEEIKVEDEPQGGLNVLAHAVELTTITSPPTNNTTAQTPIPPSRTSPPGSPTSSLTSFSADDPRIRLPTPPSQSPPPQPAIRPQDPVMREVALGLRQRSASAAGLPESEPKRKKPGPKPGWKKALEAQQALLAQQSPKSPQDAQRQYGRRTTARRRHSDARPRPANHVPTGRRNSEGKSLLRVARSSLSPISSRKSRISTPVATRKSSSPVAVRNPTPGRGTVVRGPVRSAADEAEARRLQALFSHEEISALRKQRRRASDFLFPVTSLRRELERLGKAY